MRFTLYLLALALLALPGCKGCRDTKTLTKSEAEEKLAEEKKKKKEEEKEPFEFGKVYSLPADLERHDTQFKPGHWTEFTSEVWANHDAFSGELVTDPFKMAAPWQWPPGQRAREISSYRLGTSRPALLPKQQKKHLGMVLFVPAGDGGSQIHQRLTPRGSSRSVKEQLFNARRMPSWCFGFLVLSKNSTDYAFLNHAAMDALTPGRQRGRESVAADMDQHRYYNVRIPKLDRYVPISENSLAWTSTAYVLWDGIDPALLSEDQQRAMIDWLHWGGQLIVSGPDSMDLLKDSFLSPYLPATAEADIPLTKDDFKTFNEDWTNKEQQLNLPPGKAKAKPAKPRRLNIVQPWSGKKLKPADDAGVEVLAKSDRADGSPLVVDRRVGLGRIALTAFRLTQKELRLDRWPSFDAFLNGCLLRHPPREFELGDAFTNSIVAVWRDPSGTLRRRNDNRFDEDDSGDPRAFGPRIRESLDPAIVSRVRYFTRDAMLSSGSQQALNNAEGFRDERKLDDRGDFLIDDRPSRGIAIDSDELTPRGPSTFGSGVAGWNDFNHPGQLARNTLTDASDIVIPRADKVVMLLAIYLAVLVPLNWLVFRIINRVEWAWIAAPLITIAATVVVIRYAELDIGFARSRSELAVVEIQGEYPRAHVTRYTGVYTSLATAYDVEFSDPGSVIQPYATHSRKELLDKPLFNLGSTTVQFRRDDQQIAMTGFDVNSNSTGMLHAEHMLDVGGGIAARQIQGDRYAITNRTKLDLKGAAVLSRAGAAWIGDFDAGQEKTVTLVPRSPARVASTVAAAAKAALSDPPPDGDEASKLSRVEQGVRETQNDADWFAERETAPITARARREDVLKARLLIRLAEHPDTLADGELRLVAWTNTELPGMEITPRASQARFANVIVAHLRYDGPIKYKTWTLGKRNDDHLSREQIAQSSLDDLGDARGPDGELSDVPDDPAALAALVQKFLQRHDKNKNGTLERAEWPRDNAIQFDEPDTDGNGKVTAAEIEAFLRKLNSLPPQ